MIEPLSDAQEHPTIEELAALAESGSRGDLRHGELVRHLSHCRTCMATYAELAHTYLRATVDPEIADPPAELIELGLGARESARDTEAAVPRRRHHQRMAAALALVGAGALAGFLLLGRPSQEPPVAPSLELRHVLAEKLRDDSQGGLLYADDLMPRRRGLRGGNGHESVSPQAITELVSLYNRGGSSADVAYWLVAAYLATNQLRNADTYLGEALENFPNDSRFHNLAAILSYKRDGSAAAETHLRRALELGRPPVALLNFAIVRREQGFEDEAQTLFHEILASCPGSTIASYAEELAKRAP